MFPYICSSSCVSHPEAEGLGERSEVAQISETMASMIGLPYPKCVHKVSSHQLATLAEHYEKHVCELAGDTRRTVDKMPDNFLYLGLIAMLFPKAHVIHCRRNPLDICLSCYRSDFGGVRWAWTLDDIGHYFVQYHRLMAHWKENLPLHIHDVKYEDLISNKYETFRDIIVFTNTLMNRVEGVNKSKLQKAIETTNFNVLKKKEISETFEGSESNFKNWRKFHSENKNLFFNLGPENNWKKILNTKISKEIEINFKKQMEELEYL